MNRSATIGGVKRRIPSRLWLYELISSISRGDTSMRSWISHDASHAARVMIVNVIFHMSSFWRAA